jgi:hypothetical protein
MIAVSVAQKKLAVVNQSSLTGISLPAGTHKDSRMISVTGAKLLLELESKNQHRIIINRSAAVATCWCWWI